MSVPVCCVGGRKSRSWKQVRPGHWICGNFTYLIHCRVSPSRRSYSAILAFYPRSYQFYMNRRDLTRICLETEHKQTSYINQVTTTPSFQETKKDKKTKTKRICLKKSVSGDIARAYDGRYPHISTVSTLLERLQKKGLAPAPAPRLRNPHILQRFAELGFEFLSYLGQAM